MSVQLNVRANEKVVEKIDELVKVGQYKNRSEAVNEALNIFVGMQEEKKTEKMLRETPYSLAYGMGRRDAAREALALLIASEDMEKIEERIREIAAKNKGKGSITKALIRARETEE